MCAAELRGSWTGTIGCRGPNGRRGSRTRSGTRRTIQQRVGMPRPGIGGSDAGTSQPQPCVRAELRRREQQERAKSRKWKVPRMLSRAPGHEADEAVEDVW